MWQSFHFLVAILFSKVACHSKWHLSLKLEISFLQHNNLWLFPIFWKKLHAFFTVNSFWTRPSSPLLQGITYNPSPPPKSINWQFLNLKKVHIYPRPGFEPRSLGAVSRWLIRNATMPHTKLLDTVTKQ